jgi:hypothetical protein
VNERFFVRRTTTRLRFRYKAALLLVLLLAIWLFRVPLLTSLGRCLRVDSHFDKVYAHSTDIYINEHNWWYSVNGIKRVINEYIKLTVYWLRGYI